MQAASGCLSGLDERHRPRWGKARLLRAPAARLEGVGRSRARKWCPRRWRSMRSVRVDPRPHPCPLGRQDRDRRPTSARATPSTVRSPRSRRPTPIRTSATTRPSKPPPRASGSLQRSGYSERGWAFSPGSSERRVRALAFAPGIVLIGVGVGVTLTPSGSTSCNQVSAEEKQGEISGLPRAISILGSARHHRRALDPRVDPAHHDPEQDRYLHGRRRGARGRVLLGGRWIRSSDRRRSGRGASTARLLLFEDLHQGGLTALTADTRGVIGVIVPLLPPRGAQGACPGTRLGRSCIPPTRWRRPSRSLAEPTSRRHGCGRRPRLPDRELRPARRRWPPVRSHGRSGQSLTSAPVPGGGYLRASSAREV